MKNILLLILFCLFGCGVFKKTSKTTSSTTQSSTNQLESSQLVLKSAGKETQVFTYWNDSGFYQFQHIKEQVDETKSDDLKTMEEQKMGQITTVKESEFLKNWIYGIILIVLIAAGLMYYGKIQS